MPQTLGIHNEFLSAPRLDNLTSVHACLSGLMESSRKRGICVAALYDNEEIGSSTKQGAASPLTDRILEKIYLSLGYSRSDFLDALFGGFLPLSGCGPTLTIQTRVRNTIQRTAFC